MEVVKFMSENTKEMKNQEYGIYYELPFDITSALSEKTKESIRHHYILAMTQVLGRSPKTACFM